MRQPSDSKLILRITQGDREALAALYGRYWKAARAAAYGVTADFASAEDAAAEGLESSLRSLHELKRPESFGPWLRTIVIRAARRQRVRHICWGEMHTLADRPTHEDPMERRETAALVHEAVNRLPRLLRESMCLHYFEGYSVSEAAGFLGVPTGTVKRRLHEGRQRLAHTCAGILQGRRPMNTDDQKLAARLDAVSAEGMDQAEFKQLLREALRLRPLPHDLRHKLVKSRIGPLLGGSRWPAARLKILAAMHEHGRPSPGVLDASHPNGQAAAKILDSLPGFQRWEVSPEEMLDSFVARYGPPSNSVSRSQPPPGMAEGRPAAYYQLAAGVVVLGTGGDLKTVADLVAEEGSGDSMARLSDVIDLSWRETRPLGLHEVEALLRAVCRKTVPSTGFRFSAHDEPRYRAGLRLYLGSCPTPAATGGVLEPWPEMPEGAAAAHIRIYLEVWGSIISGSPVGFRAMPAVDLK